MCRAGRLLLLGRYTPLHAITSHYISLQNLWAVPVAFFSSVASDGFKLGFAFIGRHPACLVDILIVSLCAALGQASARAEPCRCVPQRESLSLRRVLRSHRLFSPLIVALCTALG